MRKRRRAEIATVANDDDIDYLLIRARGKSKGVN